MWQMVRTKNIFHKKSFDSEVTDSNYDWVLIWLSDTTSKSGNPYIFSLRKE